jgi:heat shock protein HslJ
MRYLAIFSCLLLTACASKPMNSIDPLLGFEWVSTTQTESKPPASFRLEPGGGVSGTDGCNRFTGPAKIGERIDFSRLAVTRMLCDHGRDVAFWEALNQHNNWKVRKGELLLMRDKKVIWRFDAVEPEPAAVDEVGEEE